MGSVDVVVVEQDRALGAAPGISSCIRLMQRTSVDLPHPDGPMIAVTWLGGNSMLIPFDRMPIAVVGVQILDRDAVP